MIENEEDRDLDIIYDEEPSEDEKADASLKTPDQFASDLMDKLCIPSSDR